MVKLIDSKQLVSLEELAVSNAYEIAALVAVLARKGILTQAEVFAIIYLTQELSRTIFLGRMQPLDVILNVLHGLGVKDVLRKFTAGHVLGMLLLCHEVNYGRYEPCPIS